MRSKARALERAITDTANSIRENFGVDVAIRVFELNTEISPRSENAWDSLAEAYDREGDKEKAKSLRDKARLLLE